MKKFLKKMIIPTIILAWATFYLLEVLQYPPKNYLFIKPIYFVLLAFYVLNAVLDYLECRKDKSEKTEKVPFKQAVNEFVHSDGMKIVEVFAAVIVAALLFNVLGFFIVVPIFLFGMLFIAGERKVWILIAVPIVVTGLLYLLFGVGLQIRLPFGIL